MLGTDLSRIDFALGSNLFNSIPGTDWNIAILIINIGPASLVGVGIYLFYDCHCLFHWKLFAYRKKPILY